MFSSLHNWGANMAHGFSTAMRTVGLDALATNDFCLPPPSEAPARPVKSDRRKPTFISGGSSAGPSLPASSRVDPAPIAGLAAGAGTLLKPVVEVLPTPGLPVAPEPLSAPIIQATIVSAAAGDAPASSAMRGFAPIATIPAESRTTSHWMPVGNNRERKRDRRNARSAKGRAQSAVDRITAYLGSLVTQVQKIEPTLGPLGRSAQVKSEALIRELLGPNDELPARRPFREPRATAWAMLKYLRALGAANHVDIAARALAVDTLIAAHPEVDFSALGTDRLATDFVVRTAHGASRALAEATLAAASDGPRPSSDPGPIVESVPDDVDRASSFGHGFSSDNSGDGPFGEALRALATWTGTIKVGGVPVRIADVPRAPPLPEAAATPFFTEEPVAGLPPRQAMSDSIHEQWIKRSYLCGCTNAGRPSRELKPIEAATLVRAVSGHALAEWLLLVGARACCCTPNFPLLVRGLLQMTANAPFGMPLIHYACTVANLGLSTCSNEAHDLEAIRLWLLDRPAFGIEGRPWLLDEGHPNLFGFGHFSCPLCWPDNGEWYSVPLTHGPQHIKSLPSQMAAMATVVATSPLREDRGVLHILMAAAPLEVLGPYRPDVTLIVSTCEQPHAERLGARHYALDPAIIADLGPMVFAWAFGAREASTVVITGVSALPYLSAEAVLIPRAVYALDSGDGATGLGWVIQPALARPMDVQLASSLAGASTDGQVGFVMLSSAIRTRVVLATAGELSGSGPARFRQTQINYAPPLPLDIVGARDSVARRTPGTSWVQSSAAFVAISAATSNAAPLGAGRAHYAPEERHRLVPRFVALNQEIPAPLPTRSCACSICRLGRIAGPVAFGLYGTRGDRVPYMAAAKYLAAAGVDVIVLELDDEIKAQEKLQSIHRGEVLALSSDVLRAIARLSSFRGLTIGPPAVRPTVRLSAATPEEERRGWEFRLGPLLDPLLEVFSGVGRTDFRFGISGAYNELPLSSDGSTFDKVSTSTRGRSGTLWALGSSGLVAPPGSDVIKPGDHYSQMERASVVVTHGGAGTVRTARLAGARVVAFDATLDRRYEDATNVLPGPVHSASPDMVLALLLGGGFGVIPYAFSLGYSTGLTVLLAYVRVYLASDIATAALVLTLSPRPVFLPGSLALSVVATMAGVLVSPSLAALFALGSFVWGATVLARYGFAPATLIRRTLVWTRVLSAEPLALLPLAFGQPAIAVATWTAVRWGPGLFGSYLLARDSPKAYLQFVRLRGTLPLPAHVRFLSLDRKTVLQGMDVSGLGARVYVAALTPLEELDGDVFAELPMSVDPFALGAPIGGAPYHFLFWNCGTVLQLVLSGLGARAGIAGVVLIIWLAIGLVTGMLAVVTTAAASMALLFVTSNFAAGYVGQGSPIWWLAHLTSRVHAVAMVRASSSFSVQMSGYARAMWFAAGLTAEESELIDDSELICERVVESLQADDPASRADLYDAVASYLAAGGSLLPSAIGLCNGLAALLGRAPFVLESLTSLADRPTWAKAQARLTPLPTEPPSDDLGFNLRELARVLSEASDYTPEAYNELVDEATGIVTEIELLGGNWTADLRDSLYSLFNEQVDNSSTDCLMLWADLVTRWDGSFDNSEQFRVAFNNWNDLNISFEDAVWPFTREVATAMPAVGDSREAWATPEQHDALVAGVAIGRAFGLDWHEAFSNAAINMPSLLHPYEDSAYSRRRVASSPFTRFADLVSILSGTIGFVSNGMQWVVTAAASNHVTVVLVSPVRLAFRLIGLVLAWVWTLIYTSVSVVVETLTTAMPSLKRFRDTVRRYLAALMAAADPAHRTRAKPAWALLTASKRVTLSPAEQLVFALSPSTHVDLNQTYEGWATQMIDLLNEAGCDTSFLNTRLPERAVFYPNDPVGLPEYNELDLATEVTFKENAIARRTMMQSIEAGNPLSIDGVWLATPAAVARSLSRYTVSRPEPTEETIGLIEMAADALTEQFPLLYDKPLPMSVAQTMRAVTKKYASGPLFYGTHLRKKAALFSSDTARGVAHAVERILTSGDWPRDVAGGFPKNAVQSIAKIAVKPDALRSITAANVFTGLAVNTLLLERNKRVPPREYGQLNLMTRSEGGMLAIKKWVDELPHKFTSDGESFDSTAMAELATVGIVRMFANGFRQHEMLNGRAAEAAVHAYYTGLTKGMIVNLADGSVVDKTGGGGTGSAGTSPDNRDLTRLSWLVGWMHATGRPAREFFDHFRFGNSSDDIFGSTSDYGKSVLPAMLASMRLLVGVKFNVDWQDAMNGILRTEAVSNDDVEWALYDLLGIERPAQAIRHDPQRLLFTRSAFRADRVRNNAISLYAHIAERSCGYQLLTAHSRDMYELVTTDLVEANMKTASAYFEGVEIVNSRRDDTHALDDAWIEIVNRAPGKWLRNRVGVMAHRYGMTDDEKNVYIAKEQRRMERALRQRRGMSYNKVFYAWTKAPPAVEDSKASKRWRKYRDIAIGWGPVGDLVRLGTVKLDAALEVIGRPFSTLAATVQPVPLGQGMDLGVYSIESFVWRHMYDRNGTAPSVAEFVSEVRSSSWAGVTDASGFFNWLSLNDNLAALAARPIDTFGPPLRQASLRLDALTGKMILLTLVYYAVDRFVEWLKKLPFIGLLVILLLLGTKILGIVYSIQSTVFWLGTGSGSLAISNTMVKDHYLAMKVLATVVTYAIPNVVTDHFAGLARVMASIAKWIELQAWLPAMFARANMQAANAASMPVPDTWDRTVHDLNSMNPGEVRLLPAPTGAGKSTSFVAAALQDRTLPMVVLLLPRSRLVLDYRNAFIDQALYSVSTIVRDDMDMTVAPSLLVTTPGQYAWRIRRAPLAGVSHVLLWDEIQDVNTDSVRAYAAYLMASALCEIKLLIMSATPIGVMSRLLAPHGNLHVPPPRPRPPFELLPAVGSVDEAIVALRDRGVALSTTVIYHPSRKWCKTMSAGFSAAGVDNFVISAIDEPKPRRALRLATAVIASGANLDPPPAAIVYHRLMLRRRLMPTIVQVTTPYGVVQRPRQHLVTNLVELVLVPFTLFDDVQMSGRVGRTVAGLAIPIGDLGPGEPDPVFDIFVFRVLDARASERLLTEIDQTSGPTYVHQPTAEFGILGCIEASGSEAWAKWLLAVAMFSTDPTGAMSRENLTTADVILGSAVIEWIDAINEALFTFELPPITRGDLMTPEDVSYEIATKSVGFTVHGPVLGLFPFFVGDKLYTYEGPLRPLQIEDLPAPRVDLEADFRLSTVTWLHRRWTINSVDRTLPLGLGYGPRPPGLGRNPAPLLRPCGCTRAVGNHGLMEGRSLDYPGVYGLPRDANLLLAPAEAWSIAKFLRDFEATLRASLADLEPGTRIDVRTWNGTLRDNGVVVVLVPVHENPARLPGRIYVDLPAAYSDKVALAHARLLPYFLDIGDFQVFTSNGRPEPWMDPFSLTPVEHRIVSHGYHRMPLNEALLGPSGIARDQFDAFARVLGKHFYTYAIDAAIITGMAIIVQAPDSRIRHNQAIWPGTRMVVDFDLVDPAGVVAKVTRFPPRGFHNLQA